MLSLKEARKYFGELITTHRSLTTRWIVYDAKRRRRTTITRVPDSSAGGPAKLGVEMSLG